MFSGFLRELKSQIVTLAKLVRTREFWIYLGVILLMLLIAFAGIRVATGFDPLSRGQLHMGFSCKTGEGQLATIIIGSFAFAIACLFTLGEVIHWVEETRQSRAPGRQHYKIGSWRPVLHVLGTTVLGVGGYLLMLTWCT
jgi:hypothetical protein